MNADIIAFVEAVSRAFPIQKRDRYGRYVGPVDFEKLRELAVKYRTAPAYDTMEQAGNVARALLAALASEHVIDPWRRDEPICRWDGKGGENE